MTRARFARLALLLAAALVPAGCAGMGGTPAPADTDAIAARVQAVGIAPDLVYVTDVDGFDLATQSVGILGDEGMSATYTRIAGDDVSMLTLATSRAGTTPADPSAVPCADVADGDGPPPACVVEHGAALVRIEGDGVDGATLRAAGEAVRVPGAGELDRVFADVPTELEPPVERGDLPEEGDGAPDNEPGVGG